MFFAALWTRNRTHRRLRGQFVVILSAGWLAVAVTSATAQEAGSPTSAPAGGPAAQHLPFDSDHQEWRSADQGDVTVFWAGGDDAPGVAALAIAGEARRQLDLILPVAGGTPTSVYVFSSTAELREALQSAGLEWSSDLSDLPGGAVWVTTINPRTAQQELARTLPRQMLSRRLAALGSRNRDALPDWFLSGLPGLFEEAATSSYDGLVREALESRRLIPLAQLCAEYPAEDMTRSLAEAESKSLLAHVRAHYGDEALGRLAGAYAAGENCTAGISRALGLSDQQLEEEWLAARFGHVSFGAFWRSNAAWLLLLVFGFLLSGLLLIPTRPQSGGEF